jgi:hypothetical protein
MKRVTATLADSICLFVILQYSNVFKPKTPKAISAPRVAVFLFLPFWGFLNFVRLGNNIS